MSDRDPEPRGAEEESEREEALRDLDVPQEQLDDIAGGTVRKAGDKPLEY